MGGVAWGGIGLGQVQGSVTMQTLHKTLWRQMIHSHICVLVNMFNNVFMIVVVK